jgi:hypothetical protein
MKSIFSILLIASVSAQPAELGAVPDAPAAPAAATSVADPFVPAPAGAVHFFDFDNAKMLYKGNFEQYRDDREA